MDLIFAPAARLRRRIVLGLIVVAMMGGCSSSDAPFELSEDATELPATLMEAHRLASALAVGISERAYVHKMGGGFTLMDSQGRSRHHSFVFYAREGIGATRRITIHLIGGTPWLLEENVNSPPPPFNDVTELADSDAAVAAALDWAAEGNAVRPDSVPVPALPEAGENQFRYAAKILSVAQWPEPNTTADPPRIAWRVDFLEERIAGGGSVPVPWSIARFYFDPVTLEQLGRPIVQTELYPRP